MTVPAPTPHKARPERTCPAGCLKPLLAAAAVIRPTLKRTAGRPANHQTSQSFSCMVSLQAVRFHYELTGQYESPGTNLIRSTAHAQRVLPISCRPTDGRTAGCPTYKRWRHATIKAFSTMSTSRRKRWRSTGPRGRRAVGQTAGRCDGSAPGNRQPSAVYRRK